MPHVIVSPTSKPAIPNLAPLSGWVRQAEEGGERTKERSYALEPQVSTQMAEPRESTHQDERAAQQVEVSGHPGCAEDRFEAMASSAAASGRQRAQHGEPDPQPSRSAPTAVLAMLSARYQWESTMTVHRPGRLTVHEFYSWLVHQVYALPSGCECMVLHAC
jgi:hypothetical protein